jgi:DNA-binding NarL/FixJ family response regulator
MVKLRVTLADDHALLRAGLAVLINAQDDMEVVAQAASVDEVVHAVSQSKPDILVLDLTMPGGSSIQVIEQLRQQSPQTKILVLTMHDEPAYVRATLGAGCAGYLVKTASDAEMLSALRTIAQGRMAINVPLSNDEMKTVLGNTAPQPGSRALLSARESEVLKLLALGHTNTQIADKLFLSVKTIETYRSRIGEKLGLRDRAELVAYAINVGLLTRSEVV